MVARALRALDLPELRLQEPRVRHEPVHLRETGGTGYLVLFREEAAYIVRLV